ncbi:MAG: DNA mismatch repair endonuclease MutL, partial [Oscillospiraceae bacterium]|nr:DNA mismatch repair endonuclease MutL [Oscillospiraceae bacterium]
MIEILSPSVANLIAAGEVVERPASALKELLENAVDAGATAVTAEIKRGGVSLIRVTDNGEGMDAGDAARAFMRHATSKLRTAEDLRAIVTMGFRGEALAAIAAVSRVELLTRRRGAASGASLSLEAGAVTASGEAGCPEGTTVVVRDLFFNTPARQKFLKKDSTEAAAAQEAAVRTALARPSLSVRFIKDGAQALHTPGDGDLKNCLYSLFGGEFVRSLCPLPQAPPGPDHAGGAARFPLPDIRVSGFTGLPSLARSARFMQYFFVEGRPVRARVLTAALEEAYAGALMGGRFPVCCLHISMPPDTFDINVHPAKSEIKFQTERAVFNAVYAACREALRQAGPDAAPAVRINPYGRSGGRLPVMDAASPSLFSVAPPAGSGGHSLPSPSGARGGALPRPVTPVPPSERGQSPSPPPEEGTAEQRGESPESPPDTPSWRLVGEALTGYLLVDTPEALWVIDKHAAHERLLYNRLKAGEKPFLSQQLLVPRTVVLSGPELDILLR